MTVAKSRHFMAIVYPESAPPDWREALKASFLKAAISPLHDQDLNDDGTKKKAHYHVLIEWSNTTTLNAVRQAGKRWGLAVVTTISNPAKAYQYLWHKNEDKKHIYDEKQVECLNGFKPKEDQEKIDEAQQFYEIIEIIQTLKIPSMLSLINILMAMKNYEMIKEIKKNAYFYKTIINDNNKNM